MNETYLHTLLLLHISTIDFYGKCRDLLLLLFSSYFHKQCEIFLKKNARLFNTLTLQNESKPLNLFSLGFLKK